MRVWLVTVVVLFLGVQLYQWLQGFMLPLPIYVMAGAFLAIASNYEKGMSALFPSFSTSQEPLQQTATLIESLEILEESKVNQGEIGSKT